VTSAAVCLDDLYIRKSDASITMTKMNASYITVYLMHHSDCGYISYRKEHVINGNICTSSLVIETKHWNRTRMMDKA
jgi:hypothetical protein